jgi:hypothetical protein
MLPSYEILHGLAPQEFGSQLLAMPKMLFCCHCSSMVEKRVSTTILCVLSFVQSMSNNVRSTFYGPVWGFRSALRGEFHLQHYFYDFDRNRPLRGDFHLITTLRSRSADGCIYGPKPYKCVRFGNIYVTKPYKFIGFGNIYVTKPYKFIGFGAIGFNTRSARCRSKRIRRRRTSRVLRSEERLRNVSGTFRAAPAAHRPPLKPKAKLQCSHKGVQKTSRTGLGIWLRG